MAKDWSHFFEASSRLVEAAEIAPSGDDVLGGFVVNPFSDLPKRGRNHEVEELAIAALRHAWLKAERAYCRVWTRKQLMQQLYQYYSPLDC